jgi:hypothetical protein
MPPRPLQAAVFLALIGCAAPAKTSRDAAQIVGMVAGKTGQTATAERTSEYCNPVCADGYACNNDTATCVRIPCGGKCRGDQVCNTSGMIESCVAANPAQPLTPPPPERVTPQ